MSLNIKDFALASRNDTRVLSVWFFRMGLFLSLFCQMSFSSVVECAATLPPLQNSPDSHLQMELSRFLILQSSSLKMGAFAPAAIPQRWANYPTSRSGGSINQLTREQIRDRIYWPIVQVSGASLLDVVKSLEGSDQEVACDRRLRDTKRRLASAVDSATDDVNRWLRNQPTGLDPNYQAVALGKLQVFERVTPLPEPQGWHEGVVGWEQVEQFYSRIENTSIDANWLWFSIWVRSLVLDDLRRLKFNVSFVFDEHSENTSKEVGALITACVVDQTCIRPMFSPMQNSFLRRDLKMRQWLADIEKIYSLDPGDRARKSKRLWSLIADRLQLEREKRFAHMKNTEVSRVNRDTFRVRMDAHDFQGFEQQLSDWMESVWTNGSMKVEIEWKKRQDGDNGIFYFEADPSGGGRSLTWLDEKKITVSHGAYTATLAHELGHVLGFQDQYFEIFEEPRCEYRMRLNDEDVMSNPFMGSATAEEWLELQRLAPM